MAGRIPQSFIDDLVARADIVEIINARVPLKRKGKEYMACCPFHNEKTPSFTVSESKQFYHCFGCGAHGTALGFLMEYDNLEFVDAVEELASIYNLEVPREQGVQTRRDDKQPLFDALAQANTLYQQQLKQSERAVAYLKQRGLTGEIARHYQLGYAPDGWGFLTSKLSDKTRELAATGMLVKKDNGGFYDRFRDRIMFPITNRRGKVIGFGGRILDKGEPKYLNSPENALFHKGLEVYGLFEAKKANRELQRIVVVEGYMDVVALAQFGISYAVASLGTATTKEQIQGIFRATQQIVFCYDGDQAGRKAAWRALQNTLEVIRDGQHARFLFLPDGEDPDSLVRQEGREAFEARLDSATSLSDFLFEQLMQQCDMSTLEGRAKLAELCTPMLNKMPDSLFRDMLFDKLSGHTHVGVDKLRGKTAQTSAVQKQTTTPDIAATHPGKSSATRDAITLLLQYPGFANDCDIPDTFGSCDIQGYTLLSRLVSAIKQAGITTPQVLIEHWRNEPDFDIVNKLLQRTVQGADDIATARSVYIDSVRAMQKKYNDLRFEYLQNKLQTQGQGSLSEAEMQEYKNLISH